MVKANHLVLNHAEGRGYATGASVRIKDVPIFYSPVFPFPVGRKRHSGFLAPHYAHSSSSGRELIAPYYFNLAPNQDLTLSLHALEDRGGQLESNWRYLGELSHGHFYLSGLPYDRKFAHYRREHSIPTPILAGSDPRVTALRDASPRRFATAFEHYATLSQHFTGNAVFHYVSDDNYLVDELSHHMLSKQERQLRRGAGLTYRSKHWTAKSVVEGYQTLQPFDTPIIAEPYQLLPQLMLHGDYFYGYNRPHFELLGQATYFHHEGDPVNNASLTTGSRTHLKPTLSIPWYQPWGFLTPSLAVALTQYHLNLNTQDKAAGKPHHPSRILPMATVDTGLWFDRHFSFGRGNYTQTLEPRAFYIYIPYVDQNSLPNFDSSRNTFTIHQLFTVNRFNSIDRIGDAHQLSLALTSRIKANATGQERLWLQVAQRYHFRERQVTLCDTQVSPSCRLGEDLLDPKGNRPVSPVIAELGLHLPRHWRARFETQWDTRTHHLEKYAFGLQFWADKNHIFNLAYYAADDTKPLSDRTGDDISQLDTSLVWMLTPRWRVLGRWDHNIKRKFAFNLLGGIEYNTCCLAMRLGAIRSVKLGDGMGRQYANTFSFQVILKGLTGVGVDPSIEFKRNIPDYESNF